MSSRHQVKKHGENIMKAPDITRWDRKPGIEGLLLFAQTVDELLFDYTIDTYKIPALNSRILV